MKAIPALALFLTATLAAHADVIVEQNLESPQVNGKMVMKVKGDQGRIDMPSPAGEVTVIMNFKTGEMLTLVHGQKMAMKGDLKTMKAQVEAQQKASGVDPAKVEKPKPTGTTEKVGEWTADVYDVQSGPVSGKIWAAKDYPNAQPIKDEMKKLTEAMSTGVDLSKMDVAGMIVKSVMKTPFGDVTSNLISAKQGTVPDSDFDAPVGYNEIKIPGAPGGAPK